MRKSMVKGGIAALTGLSLVVAAGCSSGKSESANTGSASPEASQVKIEYFQMKPEGVDVVNELIQKFQESNPNILVEQNNVPNPENVWTMRVSTDDAPAVFTHYPHNSVFQKMAKEGQVVDLTNDPLMANVQPAIAELSKIDGKNYLVPVGLATLGVYYNKDLFESNNIALPTTTAELYAAAEKLQAAGITPFYFHDKEYNGIRQEVVFKMGQTLPDIEQFLDDVMNGKAHITDNAAFKPFAQSLLDIRQYGQKDMMGTSYDDALRDFATGKTAMWFTGIWAIQEIAKSNPDLNFAMFPFPTENAADLKTQVSVDTAIGIPTRGKNQAEAKKFIEFMTTKESVEKYLATAGYPSGIKDVQSGREEITSLTQLINDGKIYPTIERLWPPGLNAEVGKATQEMFITKDIGKYLDALDTIFYNVLNQ
ncbi:MULTISPECIES: ABC transporter substrate-binding protein [Cohnella]|uniref:Carbohydrate ABC transporter substrate-binding protein (CUT1 family) n=1 Tax=Cohnella phaseoli TaxID=456490 RepID=A0A3D9KHU7_9BACL|nr:extracellular solute-binding protein [Cohnella phaseoli]RED85454.1 carbohydrate ABC transporter substrate-binding protein (CUT1 family) [Cohnella phaseoli]